MSALLEPLIRHYSHVPRAKDMFNFAASLPPSLEFVQIPLRLTDTEQVARLRKRFDKASRRRNLYRLLGGLYAPQLQAMGIGNPQIDRMVQEGLRPKSPAGEPLDFTIDHMLSLSLGGTNEITNLCLLPGKLNHLKNILERLQIERPRGAAKDGLLTTIMPRMAGEYREQVPFIEGGYQVRIENAGRKQHEPSR